ncbi:hypothetical protein JMJ35_008562 [Cladonia borealis]|uniref:Zn(2)-C6 fungal-type domain-containing protein n=1 Tax=Cladonia borealis TaxID=184061 RepID=A0AA39QVH3_9LECA|nr:hypothetical protein JMJ35_008562 [Cladonia borealis]
MGPSSAAIALRESFGDRRPPDISRKITACVACRKLKIKCHMNDSKPPCSRCNTRKLPCTVNKSIQMLLESDLDWKEAMQKRIGRIENSITSSASTGSCLDRHDHSAPQMLPNTNGGRISPESSTSLGAFPASSMDDLVLNDKENSSSGGIDLASRGLVSQKTLEKHFDYYCENLDHFIHRILPAGDTLASVQRRSSLLLAAICTTAAVCAGSDDYQTCLDAFIGEVTTKMFSSTHTFDDVRALCIGAFWLGKISSALNALAARIAGELNLHRCITKMPHTKKICYDRSRLHFLVYICDHHCSLSHGRPPMTREIKAVKSLRALKFSTAADLDLISQVELWSISTQVFDSFGAATDRTFVHSRRRPPEETDGGYERADSTYDDVDRGNMADGAFVTNVLESGQDWLMLPHDLGLDFPGVGDLDFSCTEW